MNKKTYLTLLFATMMVANLFAQTRTVFNSCDNVTNWDNGTGQLNVDNLEKKEGNGSLSITGNYTERFIWNSDNGVNSDVTIENGYLSFWLYISDVSKLTNDDGQIEIRSEHNQGDKFELNWSVNQTFSKFNVSNGWNKIILKLSEGNADADAIDLSQIKYFRIYMFLSESVITKIDNIVFYSSGSNSFDNAESLSNWNGNLTLDVNSFEEGEASLSNNGGSNDLRFEKTLPGTEVFNTGVTKNDGYMSFWFYIADKDQYINNGDGGQVEISSDKGGDRKEYNWVFDQQVLNQLNNGWNKVVLKLSDANESDGGADLTAINYFRIYFFSNVQLATKIDNIVFSDNPNILPVNLKYFTAGIKTNQASISWQTLTETNNSHFEVLRSTNGVDFISIKTVKSQGAATYSIIDPSPSNGVNYYKLLQFDHDGKVNDFGIRTLNYALDQKLGVSVYPTYVTDQFNIKLNGSKGELNISLIDVSGKVVLKKRVIITEGEDLITVKTGNHSFKGLHVLNVSGAGLQQSVKLIFN